LEWIFLYFCWKFRENKNVKFSPDFRRKFQWK